VSSRRTWQHGGMDKGDERRVARNEVLFRETNEAIERGQWPGEPDKLVRFRCECSRLKCGEALSATLAEYEQVRAFSRRFLVADGHQVPEIETVVDANDRFLVVEKKDTAGEIAAASDPRN
jgi:hypothetical protein